MTEPKDFLSRWSQRKRDARTETKAETKADAHTESADQPNRNPVGAKNAAEQDASPQQMVAQTRDTKREDAFDLSKLPSLESIGPATDIRMFMQPGVPEALSRAALRRAWSTDPGIRDFIGLAENSWDFTASDGMHGFGALDPADAKRLLAQFFSESDPKDAKEGGGDTPDVSPDNAVSDAEIRQDEAPNPDSPSQDDDAIASEPVSGSDSNRHIPVAASAASQQEITSVATQKKEAELARTSAPMPRAHGRALPQ